MDADTTARPHALKWVAIAAGVALVAAVTVALIYRSGDSPLTKVDLAAAAEVSDHLETIDAMSYGTWRQHSAGAYLDYRANTVAVKTCMTSMGEHFGYRFIDPYAGRPEQLGVGDSWSEPLMSSASSELALASAEYDWLAAKFGDGNPDWNWDDKSASYQHAYGRCRHLRTNDPGHPPKYLDISSDLAGLVHDAEGDLGPSSEYDGCMKDAGFDVYWDDFGGPDAMHMMVQDRAPSLDLSPAKLVKTREWKDYLAFEQEALTADYNCRVDKFVAVMATIEKPLADFESAHTAELENMQSLWEVIEAEAEADGWVPADQ